MAAAAEGRAALRALLRSIQRNITSVSGDKKFRNFVLEESRKNAGVDDARKMALTKLSQEYTYLVDGVFAHKELLISYQISVDKEADTVERVKHTAARVGLSMHPDIVPHKQ